MKKISVITITYNAELYVEETLRSIANQTYKDFEHIVWDGGSRDATLDKIRLFPHVQLHQGKDSGISDAMNQGAARASGEYLLFLHADDLLATTTSLEELASYLDQTPKPVWIYGRANLIDAEGRVTRVTPNEPYSATRLRRYNFFTHPSTLVERSLFAQVGGFQTRWKYCMDYDLWLRLALHAEPLEIPVILSCFREHGGSTSTAYPLAVTDEAYQIRNQYVTTWWERWRSYRTWKKRRCSLS